jgi:hypothetical protein
MQIDIDIANRIVIRLEQEEQAIFIKRSMDMNKTVPQFVMWLLQAGMKIYELTLEVKGA